jgi:hypothetical protein
MASAGSLIVEIGANVASLRTGMEEATRRVTSLEKQVSTSAAGMQRSFEGSLAGIHSAYIKVTIGIVASLATVEKAWGMAEVATKYQEQSNILDGLAAKYNTTATSIVSAIQDATSGQVSKIEAMNIALSGVAKNLEPGQIIALAKAAELLGKTVGEEASTAFAKLTETIETGRIKAILPYLGEAARLKIAHDENGKSIKDAMKSADMYNLVIKRSEELEKGMGDQVDKTSDQMVAFKKTIDDLKLSLGQGVVAGGAAAIGTFEMMAGAIFKVIEAKNKLVAFGLQGLPNRKSDYDAAVAQEKAAGEEADILFGKTQKNYELAEKYWKMMSGEVAGTKKTSASTARMKNFPLPTDKKELERQQKELEMQARHSYEQDLQVFATTQQGKISLVNKEADNQVKQLDFIYDHSMKGYDDEMTMIKNKADVIGASYSYEMGLIELQIQNLGRSKDKKSEIAKLTEDWETAHQGQLQATSDMEMAVLDAEEKRAQGVEDSITRIWDNIGNIQAEMDRSAIGKVMGGSGSTIVNSVNEFQNQIDQTKWMYDEQIKIFQNYSDDYLKLHYGTTNRAQLIEEAAASKTAAIEKYQYLQRRVTAQNAFGAMADIASAFYEASNKESQSWFKIYKAMAIAQATIDTIVAAQAAYKAGVSIGGPYALVVGAAFAAVAVAAGAARIAQIANTNPGSANAVTGAPAEPAAAVPGKEKEAATTNNQPVHATPTIQIYVQGNIIDQDKFARELIPAITRAMGDGVR